MAKRLRSFMLNASYISFSDLTQLYNYFATHVPKDKLTFEDTSLSILLTEESQTFTINLLNMMLVIIGLVSIHNGYISLANDCLLVVQQVDYLCNYKWRTLRCRTLLIVQFVVVPTESMGV